MSIVASSLEVMANLADGVAASVKTSLSKLPVLGRLFDTNNLGALQNSERNPEIVALSKPVNTPTSFIYG